MLSITMAEWDEGQEISDVALCPGDSVMPSGRYMSSLVSQTGYMVTGIVAGNGLKE